MLQNPQKIFLISVIGVIILTLLLTFWPKDTSPKLTEQNFSYSSTNSTNQTSSQNNSANSNSSVSNFSSSLQTNNSSTSGQIMVENNSTSSEFSYSKSEVTKFGKLFSRDSEALPFFADQTHEVVVIEKCDLAVKYEKNKDYRATISQEKYFNQLEFDKFAVGLPQSGKLSTLIYCNKQAQEFEKFQGLENKNDLINIDKAEFCKRIRLNQFGCNEVTKFMTYQDPTTQFPNRYYFTQGNFLYIITSNYYDEIQFNSLAPSTPSIKL